MQSTNAGAGFAGLDPLGAGVAVGHHDHHRARMLRVAGAQPGDAVCGGRSSRAGRRSCT